MNRNAITIVPIHCPALKLTIPRGTKFTIVREGTFFSKPSGLPICQVANDEFEYVQHSSR